MRIFFTIGLNIYLGDFSQYFLENVTPVTHFHSSNFKFSTLFLTIPLFIDKLIVEFFYDLFFYEECLVSAHQ